MSVHGNREVVMALSKLLEMAQEGKIGFLVGVALYTESNTAIALKVGTNFLLPKITKAVVEMGGVLTGEVENGTLPERDPSVTADHVSFNLITAPLSFDFFTWLIDAEMTRIKEGAPAPLKVHFWRGRDGKYELTPMAKMFFDNVVRPSLSLIGAVESVDCGGRHKAMYTWHDVNAMVRAGVPVPRISVPAAVMDEGRDYITITLRETWAFPERNSDLAVWTAFAGWLEERGERVIFVRDTARANEEMPGGWSTVPRASFDLRDRARLYQGAKLNLFTANGPFSIALFMDKPFICFNEPPREDDPYYPNRPDFWRLRNGMEPGENYPWMLPQQWLIWQKPTLETLIAAYENFASESALLGSRLGVNGLPPTGGTHDNADPSAPARTASLQP